jgi:hypothetical protein
VLPLDREEKLNAKAKEIFGVTDNCAEAFFILEDGSLLKRRWKGNYYEHADIGLVYKEVDNHDRRDWKGIRDFMDEAGAIRIAPMANSTNIEYIENNGVSEEQKAALKKCICTALRPHMLTYDVVDEERKVSASGEFHESPYRDEPCTKILHQFMLYVESQDSGRER